MQNNSQPALRKAGTSQTPAAPRPLHEFPISLQREVRGALDRQHFHLLMSPTEHCNFRCTYCYEDFAIGRMKPGVVQGIKAMLGQKVPQLRSLQLSWFGGEPLLAPQIILDIASHAKELCDAHQVSLSGDLSTNAWHLSVDVVSALVAVKQTHYQVSLDGDHAYHDQTRIQANGTGSFERIWSNLLALRGSALKFSVLLRLHVHQANLSSVETLIGKLNAEFAGDSRFKAFFHDVKNYGGPGANAVEYLNSIDCQKAINALQFKLHPSLMVFDMPQICYAAKPNSLFIRPTGQIGKCTVALNAPQNNLGHIDSHGNIHISTEKLAAWAAPLYQGSNTDRQCPVKFVTRPTAA